MPRPMIAPLRAVVSLSKPPHCIAAAMPATPFSRAGSIPLTVAVRLRTPLRSTTSSPTNGATAETRGELPSILSMVAR